MSFDKMAASGRLEKVRQFNVIFSCLILLIPSCLGRIHKFRTEDDARREIDLTTFGFLKNGFLAINLTNFIYKTSTQDSEHEQDTGNFGFTLDKTVSPGISPYLEGKQDRCILKDQDDEQDMDKSVSIVFFKMDIKNLKIVIDRKGKDVEDLKIYQGLSAEAFSSTVRHRRSSSPALSDSGLFKMLRHRRAADSERAKNADTKDEIPSADDKGEISHGKVVINESLPVTVGQESTMSTATSTPLSIESYSVNDTISIKYNPITNHYSAVFLVSIETDQQQGLYNLFFHNCRNYGKNPPQSLVNFTIQITENNNGNYLSAGRMPLPSLYFCLCFVYFLLGCYWFHVIKSSTEGVFRIHYLMLGLLYVKSIALFFHAVNFYFIQKEGRHEEAFAILYYITHLMKGALLFVTIVLIGAGWAFVKHILSDRDKKIFIIVIPLQVLANVAQIIIEETEEGQSRYTMWKEIFILVDLLCCGAILFPVVWQIRRMKKDVSSACSKQKYLRVFKFYFAVIVCYIYFTRIIVYLLKITVPFQYEWLDELFRELATMVFFVVTGFKFRPASNNPYLQVSMDSDDEVEMEEVLTQNGAYDTLTKVNVKVTSNAKDVTGPSKRESSHEYD